MCEYTSMFGEKKSENLKNYNGRGSLERAYNTASGTAAKNRMGLRGLRGQFGATVNSSLKM